MKVAVVLGTRPEIIKLSPVIRELDTRKLNFFILHTGQHYSYEMDAVFLHDLRLPGAKHNLQVGSGTHGDQTGRMLIGIERVLGDEKPDVVVVLGDTNTTLAGALAARKMQLGVAHVEAGERSYDIEMPEEVNRIVADHISDYLFAAAQSKKDNLLREGLSAEKIFVTGNTLVDAMHQNLEIAKDREGILAELGLESRGYILVTVHRQESVATSERLGKILEGLGMIHRRFHLPLIFPVHPRTRNQINAMNLLIPNGVRCVDPLRFHDFLALESKAALMLTDSGGVQQETYILRIPCVTLRTTTEYPETVEAGCNVLAGYDPNTILKCAESMMGHSGDWSRELFGDGHAAQRIIETLTRKV